MYSIGSGVPKKFASGVNDICPVEFTEYDPTPGTVTEVFVQLVGVSAGVAVGSHNFSVVAVQVADPDGKSGPSVFVNRFID